MMWLKHIDPFCHLFPRAGARILRRSSNSGRVCIVRPGGLGDLVVLTRAFLELEIDPRSVDWVLEARNAIWFDALGIPYRRYDRSSDLRKSVFVDEGYAEVINSEQFHGLAAVFCSRLVSKSGKLIGFVNNPRHDLHDINAPYDSARNHELDAFKKLLSCSELLEHRECDVRGELLGQFSRSGKKEACAVVGLGGLEDPERRLSIKQWEALIQLAGRQAEKIVIIGSPRDQVFAADIVPQELSTRCLNLVGKLPFREVISAIGSSVVFVGIDSGLLHIADLLGVPSVAVFTAKKIVQWSPRHPESRVMSREGLL